MDCITWQFLLLLEFQEKGGRERGSGPFVIAFFPGALWERMTHLCEDIYSFDSHLNSATFYAIVPWVMNIECCIYWKWRSSSAYWWLQCRLMSLKGKLPAVNRGKLKGYTLLKFSLITLSAPEWLVHSGGACCFRQSWLLASGISRAVWGYGQ